MAALRTANDDLIDFLAGPAAIRPPKILQQGHSFFGVLGFALGFAFEFCELFRHSYTSVKVAARGSPSGEIRRGLNGFNGLKFAKSV